MHCDIYSQLGGSGKCHHYIKGGFCKLDNQFRCIEFINRKGVDLTHSSIRDYLRCPFLFYLNNIVGVRIKSKSTRMLMGEIMAECLHTMHLGKQITQWDWLHNKYNISDDDDTELELTKLGCMVSHYWSSGMYQFDDEVLPEENWSYFWSDDNEVYKIHGRVDARLPNKHWLLECKYTTKPENYTLFTLHDQLGTYLLGFPETQKLISRIIRVPGLRLGKNETMVDYQQRLLKDISRRPAFYFNDYSYFPSEINTTELRSRITLITHQIRHLISQDNFYQNRESCFSPYKCDMYHICSTGVVSNKVYEYRQAKEE